MTWDEPFSIGANRLASPARGPRRLAFINHPLARCPLLLVKVGGHHIGRFGIKQPLERVVKRGAARLLLDIQPFGTLGNPGGFCGA